MPLKLHYEIIGKGQPLVLLHGWGWHSKVWKPLIPQLSQSFQLVLIDLPGFGQSGMTVNDYTIENIAPQLIKIVPNEAVWLGWSLGGMLAWQMAIHHPERVKQLITVAASPRFTAAANWAGVADSTLEKFASALTTDYKSTLSGFLELQLRGSSNSEQSCQQLRKILFSRGKIPLAGLQSGLNYLRTTDLRSELTQVKCPSLHFFGRLDKLVPATISTKIPGKSIILEGCGHIPFLSQTDEFIEILLNWLKNN